MAAATQSARGVPLSTLCPKYLHSNSTSHTWPFSAIAELIDNAYDPDVRAKQFWIDKTQLDGNDCLIFMDNGNGLDYDKMHKMLSFGFSDKKAVDGQKPIGMYGNGFKSGSMRLGRDALVFSKSEGAVCVGMLSQTYLEAIKAEHIVVPIVSFKCSSHQSGGPMQWEQLCVCEEHTASLEDILRYSLFKTKEQLLTELRAIDSPSSSGATGTRIIIWNLRRTSSGETEFDLVTDRYDIRIPSEVYDSIKEEYKRPERPQGSIPQSDYSLRAYCSILYLKPRMQIIIRGQMVKAQLISKSLALVKKDHYKPIFLSQQQKRIRITFGYNTKSKDQYGMMMYHKNRLIKSYERVGCQIKASSKGVGVIGVIECDFLVPTHNKQDFDSSDDKYRKTMVSLANKLEDYWKEILHKRGNSAIPIEDTPKRPDQNWVQCVLCLKWRKLPDGVNCDLLAEKWDCHLNPDPQFRNCMVEEEPEDSDDDQTYQKTFKQHEKLTKLQEENRRKQEENRRKKQEEEQKEAHGVLAKQYKELQQQLERTRRVASSPAAADNQTTPLRRKARAKAPLLRGSPLQPSSPLQASTPRPSTPSRADTRSPTTDNLPIISEVYSLSRRRILPRTCAPNAKRSRLNGDPMNTPLSASLAEEGNSSNSSSTDVMTSPDTDNSDDIIILETNSTPRPSNTPFDLAKVKPEKHANGMSMDVDTPPRRGAMETRSTDHVATAPNLSPSPVSEQQLVHKSIPTQTEVQTFVKEESEEHGRVIKEEEGEEARGKRRVPQQEGRRPGCNTEVGGDHMDNADLGGTETEAGPSSPGPYRPLMDLGTEPGPSSPSPYRPLMDPQTMADVQAQQDQLLELMQATAQERDSYREQVQSYREEVLSYREDVQKLTSQLQELRDQQTQNMVKREHSHQACQTERPGGEAGRDEQSYKHLYEQAKLEADRLRGEKEAMLAAGHNTSSLAQQEEEASTVRDEMALQVDSMLLHLDQSNLERDELQSKMESLQQENTNLTSQCEQLQRDMEELRKEEERLRAAQAERGAAGAEAGAPGPGGAGEGESGTASASEEACRLRDLRRGVGRLLVTFVPALDLDQVNYECTVIDEILDQVTSVDRPFPGLDDIVGMDECRDVMMAMGRSVSS